MKPVIIFAFLFLIHGSVLSQGQQTAADREHFKKSSGSLVGTTVDVPTPSFVFDFTKSPELILNFGIRNRKDSASHAFSGEMKIASSNKFIPLIEGSEWLPDVSGHLTYTYMIQLLNKYEGNSRGKINNSYWWNIKGGIGHSSLETYNGDPALLNGDKITSRDVTRYELISDINFRIHPLKESFKWLTLMGKMGVGLTFNENNYVNLRTINFKEIERVVDPNGNIVELSSDEKKVRMGEIVVSDVTKLNFDFMALFTLGESFYIGINAFGQRKVSTAIESTDLGFGLSLPIMKKGDKDEAIFNFHLKYEIPDIQNEISNLSITEKRKLGFTIGVPLNKTPF